MDTSSKRSPLTGNGDGEPVNEGLAKTTCLNLLRRICINYKYSEFIRYNNDVNIEERYPPVIYFKAYGNLYPAKS